MGSRGSATTSPTGSTHFITHGPQEGRLRDDFDEVQYVANYPDLQAAFGTDYEAATRHFITHGYFEERTDDTLSVSLAALVSPDQEMAAAAAGDFLL